MNLATFSHFLATKNKGVWNPKPLDFHGDRERIRTAGLPLRREIFWRITCGSSALQKRRTAPWKAPVQRYRTLQVS